MKHPRSKLQGIQQLSNLIQLFFLANLPEEFVANKGTYWRLAYDLLQDPYHFNSQLEQMQTALEAARDQ